MNTNDLPRLVTVPEASRILGLSRDSIRDAIRTGSLRVVRTSPTGWPRIPEPDLRRWLGLDDGGRGHRG
jgi:excisionase family DNA binding protein